MQFLLAALILSPATFGGQLDERQFDGLGKYQRRVTTSSKEAQRFFNQGLCFLFAFNHDESIRSFEAATRRDPDCAMAWWGIAMAHGPHVNNPFVSPERERAGYEAAQRAIELSRRSSAVEKALIGACAARFSETQPSDRAIRDRAYSDAMAGVWAKFPRDADVAALYAESLMDLQPWDYWTPTGEPKGNAELITRLLAQSLRLNSRHPLALHLTIHAWEASNHPERAARAADDLRNLQPSLGHMVHMPSHIDVRLGAWEKAIVSNEKAIRADEAYRTLRPRQGFYRLYMGHNRHMLAHAAMLTGQSSKAIDAIDGMIAAMPVESLGEMAPILDGYFAMPFEVRIRFGKWDEILAMKAPGSELPLATSLWHMARGIAHAARGDLENARKEEAMFTASTQRVPENASFGNNSAIAVLAVARPLLRGEILVASNDLPAGISALKEAVAAEDNLRYDEPPDWINPCRHPLGAALIRAGRFIEAEAVYREDLTKLPNNGWSLFGLTDALRRQGRTLEADEVSALFDKVWARADVKISSSCLCLPSTL